MAYMVSVCNSERLICGKAQASTSHAVGEAHRKALIQPFEAPGAASQNASYVIRFKPPSVEHPCDTLDKQIKSLGAQTDSF